MQHLIDKCSDDYTWSKLIKRKLRALRCSLLHRDRWCMNDGRGSRREIGELDHITCTRCGRTFKKIYG